MKLLIGRAGVPLRQLHKHLVRRVAASLVLSTSRYAAFCPSDRAPEFLRRCEHYLGHQPGLQVWVSSGGEVTRYRATGEGRLEATGGVTRWSLIWAMSVGRVLAGTDSPWLRHLEKLLYAKIFVVDWTSTYRTVAWRFASAGSNRQTETRPALDTRGDAVVILGTGPSAYRIFEEQFAGYDVITCNSAIKSDRLLAERRVVAVCFSDACFFAGSSDYSRMFLTCLGRQAGLNQFAIYHDRDHAGLIARHVPDSARRRMHGVTFSPHFAGRHSFAEGPYQTHYGNVLTSLMLPLAATFYKRIVLVGFDGKGATRNYFWTHSDEFQFQDELPTVRTTYPCFFTEIDYDAYSVDHNAVLSVMCERIEADGREIIMAHSSSLPALAARFTPGEMTNQGCLQDGGRAA